MTAERKRFLGIIPRRQQNPRRIERSPIPILEPDYHEDIEPAQGESRERLWRGCDEILSLRPEHFMSYHFSDFVDNMIKLLGTKKQEWADRKYTSNNIVFKDDEVEGFIYFEKSTAGREHAITTRYVNQLSDEAYFNAETLQVDGLADRLGPNYFADVTRYVHWERITPPHSKSLTTDGPIEIEIKDEQQDNLSKEKTMLFLSKTYALYHEWRSQKEEGQASEIPQT